MDDNLNFKVNIRQPQFQGNWKTTSILRKLENDLNWLNESQPQLLAPASAELGTAQPQLGLHIFSS